MRILLFAATSALTLGCALASACSSAPRPKPQGPATPAVPRVAKPVFDCGGPATPIATPTPTPTPTPAPTPTPGLTIDSRGDRVVQWSARRLVVRSARDGAMQWQGTGRGAVMRHDGAQMASFEDDALTIRALPSGAEVLRAARPNGSFDAAWNDDGTRLLVVDAAPSSPGTVVYDVAARTSCRGSYAVPVASPSSFVIAIDRARAIVTWPGSAPDARGTTGILFLVEGAPLDATPITPASGSADSGFVFSRTGIVIAAVSAGAGVFVWNVRTGKHGDAMVGSEGASGIALSDEGVLVAGIMRDGHVRVWEADTTKLVREITPTTTASATPTALAFHPGRKRLLIASTAEGADGVEAWDLAAGGDAKPTWSGH